MKRNLSIVGGCFLLALIFAGLAGCAATQRPPNAVESKLYRVETNIIERIVERTNVVSITNLVQQILVEEINETNRVFVTNLVPVVTWVTNVVTATEDVEEYGFTPGPGAQAVAATGGAIGSLWGVGGLVAALLSGAFGLYGIKRSQRATLTAEALAQVIETGRQLLKTTPQGAALEEKWKSWMILHQAQAGVIADVAKIVQSAVDPGVAQVAAEKLAALVNKS